MSSISFKNVYDNPALPGECLVKPFKNYRFFFLSQESPLWKLAHCISGLVAYPVLGVLALIGMCFKWMSIQKTSRNQNLQRDVQAVIDKHYPGSTVRPVPGSLGKFLVS